MIREAASYIAVTVSLDDILYRSALNLTMSMADLRPFVELNPSFPFSHFCMPA
jgi:hypothetical protein